MHDERKPSPLLQQYLDELDRIIRESQPSGNEVEAVEH